MYFFRTRATGAMTTLKYYRLVFITTYVTRPKIF